MKSDVSKVKLNLSIMRCKIVRKVLLFDLSDKDSRELMSVRMFTLKQNAF